MDMPEQRSRALFATCERILQARDLPVTLETLGQVANLDTMIQAVSDDSLPEALRSEIRRHVVTLPYVDSDLSFQPGREEQAREQWGYLTMNFPHIGGFTGASLTGTP